MSDSELLQIEPLELQFPFELKKQISCSMILTNKSENHVAFKVKTTNPKKYCVRPNTGVVMPNSSCDVTVTMQAQKEAPPDMQCRDKFLLQSAVVNSWIASKDITPEMFNKDSGNQVEEYKLRVAYVPPPQPPSPVREGSEEGSSPKASVSENGTVNQASDLNKMSKGLPETNGITSEVNALISKLREEKQSAIQQNNSLRQELELVRRQGQSSTAGVPIMFVIIGGLIGIVLGYLLNGILISFVDNTNT
ncbi:vesicle-associated protein 1-1-like [Salvia hispanica]|uniref:vesicle-associated protein 1-1-like n=1 Tax=Salvia hispanica TaxID=49212 RepID=UPI002009CDED|nr:vesicle-associated protein 1-1-like [Salvia hispanica]